MEVVRLYVGFVGNLAERVSYFYIYSFRMNPMYFHITAACGIEKKNTMQRQMFPLVEKTYMYMYTTIFCFFWAFLIHCKIFLSEDIM